MNTQRKSFVALAAVLVVSLFAATAFAQTNADTSLKFVGKIDAMTKNSVTVNGHEIFLDNAKINTALSVGASVMIEGNLASDNSIHATEIDRADENFLLPDELRITGVLDSNSDSTFDFGGKLIDSSSTAVNSSLNAGAVVRIFADADSAGSWSARRVQLMNRSSADVTADAALAADFDLFNQGRYQVVGTLNSMDKNSIKVSGLTIDTANADISGDLVLGALVNVWLANDDSSTSSLHAAAVTNANIDAKGDSDSFINFGSNGNNSSDTSVDANANTNANVGANADVNSSGKNNGSDTSADTSAHANVDVNASSSTSSNNGSSSSDTSVGVNINLGGGVDVKLGGG